jgi:HEPN domain-containing protein
LSTGSRKIPKNISNLHKKDFPKTHNIDLLIKNCSAINDIFKEADVKNLEDFAVRGRYPHDFLFPSKEEAEEFYQIAVEIKKLVLKEIKDELRT